MKLERELNQLVGLTIESIKECHYDIAIHFTDNSVFVLNVQENIYLDSEDRLHLGIITQAEYDAIQQECIERKQQDVFENTVQDLAKLDLDSLEKVVERAKEYIRGDK